MRISTSQIFDSGATGIQRNQGSLLKLQNQMSTGRRILAPEDDPVAAAQALVVSQNKAVNSQFLDNQATARDELSLLDSKLGSVNNELQNVLTRAVQAGNAALSPADRGMIAQELKGSLQTLVDLANSQDGQGHYMFAGFQTQTQPFLVSANTGPYSLANQYATYQGDGGQRLLQVSPSQEIALSESGANVFMQVRDGQGNPTGRSMLDSIKNLVDILDPNSGIPFSQAAYNQALGDVHASIDNVSRVRASVGGRLSELDSLTSAGQDLGLQYDSRLSDLQDLDYVKAISDLSRQQVQLQAAQKSFAQTSQLSLFNLL